MPKAKPKPPPQPLIPVQSKPLPKGKKSNKDLFDTVFATALADMETSFDSANSGTTTNKLGTSNTSEENFVLQTPEKNTSTTGTAKRGRKRHVEPQDHSQDQPPVDDAERYPYGFSPAPTEGKYVYDDQRESESHQDDQLDE